MATWYVVENRGVADPMSLILLGVSDARGNEGKIGQFGSGAKHAVLTLLRQRLKVQFVCGSTIVIPEVLQQEVNGRRIERLQYQIREHGARLRTEKTSVTLGFGGLDWDQTAMALREIVSNAIDAVAGDWAQVSIYKAHRIEFAECSTRVYVESCREVDDWFSNVSNCFLHVKGLHELSLIRKPEPSPLRFYRKGVFVCQSEDNSLFDYNDSDGSVHIDESRKLDSYSILSHAANILQYDAAALACCLDRHTESYVETEKFSAWRLSGDALKHVWKDKYGADCLVADDVRIAELVRSKGFSCRTITNGVWFEALTQSGIIDASTRLGTVDRKGHSTQPTRDTTREVVSQVWSQLELLGLTNNKDMPAVGEFLSTMDSEDRQLYGFYDPVDNCVWLHVEHATDRKVILEELAHYVTGCNDSTRGFQDFAFRLASMLMEGKDI